MRTNTHIHIHECKYKKVRKIFHDVIIYLIFIYNTSFFMARSFILQEDFTATGVFPFHINQKQGLLTNNNKTYAHTYLQ